MYRGRRFIVKGLNRSTLSTLLKDVKSEALRIMFECNIKDNSQIRDTFYNHGLCKSI